MGGIYNNPTTIKGGGIMRLLEGDGYTFEVYKFEELPTKSKFRILENLCGNKKLDSVSEKVFECAKEYYSGVEFFEDGTVYEEV